MFLFPAIDVRGGRCVRLRRGDYAQETIFADDPVAVAKTWVAQGADRIHLVDLDGAKEGKPVNATVIRRVVDSVPVPCQVGGGLRTEADLEAVFGWGVRWAVLGTRALQEPGWVRRMAERHPARVVLGLDARDGFVATAGWLETSTTRATELAKRVEDVPLAWVVCTDIATDGMLAGPNLTGLREMIHSTKLPVVASGGVTTLDDVRAVRSAGCTGAIVGRALYEGNLNLKEALTVLGEPGV
ncbi:MAG TPA: 1-(5-phosphoribosyl)-5-[(5-phosphoribosylamino)methylideneamino]imidazole-4-carboxamide isomerase [Fimbriiglobus sp.]|jgi:phosphoribosylformimino-5-aminoimidazole carboxamide ribotide isomerase